MFSFIEDITNTPPSSLNFVLNRPLIWRTLPFILISIYTFYNISLCNVFSGYNDTLSLKRYHYIHGAKFKHFMNTLFCWWWTTFEMFATCPQLINNASFFFAFFMTTWNHELGDYDLIVLIHIGCYFVSNSMDDSFILFYRLYGRACPIEGYFMPLCLVILHLLHLAQLVF